MSVEKAPGASNDFQQLTGVQILHAFHLEPRLFGALGAIAVLFVIAFFFPAVSIVARICLLAVVCTLVAEALILFHRRGGMHAWREAPSMLSNGDDNELQIHLESRSRHTVDLRVIDEIPFQFQLRDQSFTVRLGPLEGRIIRYKLRPVERGSYNFGRLNVYVSTVIGFVSRRYVFGDTTEVPVYPSIIQMRRFELYRISNRLIEAGIKKIRRVGHTMEFEQIRPYVPGDDIRTVNWKATARHTDVMVNQYEDERTQALYCLLDKGRAMKMPFEGMTLLDYAINASLVISNVATQKHDRAGLVTFSHKIDSVVAADRRSGQMMRILETLYRQQTDFNESGYDRLHAFLRRRIRRRSLMLLFTNFETVDSLRRRLPYLRAINRNHSLVAIFFENTELRTILDACPASVEDIYIKSIAEKFSLEKYEIVSELKRYGIQSILTSPRALTVETINKYLELKARGTV